MINGGVFYRHPNRPNTTTECVVVGSPLIIMYRKGASCKQIKGGSGRYYFEAGGELVTSRSVLAKYRHICIGLFNIITSY